MKSILLQQKKVHMSAADLIADKSSDDPLWLEIKEGLDAALRGEMKIWKPRFLKSK